MAKICTHSGTFHADESLAVYMLRLLPKYSEYELVRSRNPKDWEESEIVVDVSGKYDGIKYFDHHQREFDETFPGYKTKLSSAGLIYKHFGKEIIQHKLGITGDIVDVIYQKIYKEFIESIDANDNGISKIEGDYETKFNDKNLMLPSIISNLNPIWYEEPTDEDFDKNFLKSSELMGSVFENILNYYGKSWLKSKEIVQKSLEDRFNVDESGKIIKLGNFCPWKDQLYSLEKELNTGKIEFVLFQDSSSKWRISTVPINSGSFEFRQGIKSEWRGIRDEELSKLVGIEDGIFVHANGFIGGAGSFESVLKMAKLSL
ncbi:MYG1 protein [[Candida] jaroonii]|uniref:MYG1 protein n=1 Tax=[Candida] jaroonii TaxID=467808 RepID=A0ACA9YCJ7_9ASCO|nr:MYG1 protein [[Candida] jaroonii]